MGGKLPNTDLGNDFLGMMPKAKVTKEKHVRLHQTKKLLHSKRNHQQNEKTAYGMEGKHLQAIYLIVG